MRGIGYILALLVVYAATSCGPCDKHCLCTPDVPLRDIEVLYDWSQAPDASPEGMAVLIYDVGTEGMPWRYDLHPSGGYIGVPQDSARAITYNNDTENLSFGNTGNYFSGKAYTHEGNLFDGLSETWYGPGPESRADTDQRVLVQPDPLWLYSTDGLVVNDSTALFRPVAVVARYSYLITGIKGLEGMARMCAAVTGLAGEIYLAGAIKGNEAVTVPGALQQTSADSASGALYTWGCVDNPQSRCRLQLFFWLTDGKKYCYDFDVTRQVREADDPLDVKITVNGITLPEPDNSGPGGEGGIGVDVDNWETVEIELSN
ncbi:DUF5119 domain-containing protein [Heminiphilus faecis]|uniref:DUF5119 domain-containing protein n=1 Tax=Heminiphilus faecis TaxID=2601703 RepID=A0ABV4CYD7_9BACT